MTKTYFQYLNMLPETAHYRVGWWHYHVPMILRKAKDKWRACVMPHEPMYHPSHPNQPAMLVSVSFSLQLQSVQTTPMLPNKPSSTPLRFISLSLSLFFSLFISSSTPTPSKKKDINSECPMQSCQKSGTSYFMFSYFVFGSLPSSKLKCIWGMATCFMCGQCLPKWLKQQLLTGLFWRETCAPARKCVCVCVCVNVKNDFISSRFEIRPFQDFKMSVRVKDLLSSHYNKLLMFIINCHVFACVERLKLKMKTDYILFHLCFLALFHF